MFIKYIEMGDLDKKDKRGVVGEEGTESNKGDEVQGPLTKELLPQGKESADNARKALRDIMQQLDSDNLGNSSRKE